MERTQCISETSSMMTDIQFMYSEVDKYRTECERLKKELTARHEEIDSLLKMNNDYKRCIDRCYNVSMHIIGSSKKNKKEDIIYNTERIRNYCQEVL